MIKDLNSMVDDIRILSQTKTIMRNNKYVDAFWKFEPSVELRTNKSEMFLRFSFCVSILEIGDPARDNSSMGLIQNKETFVLLVSITVEYYLRPNKSAILCLTHVNRVQGRRHNGKKTVEKYPPMVRRY
ncbi:hypothetical protein NPIL_522391 [Nephila pilipes]|uniref:Uncharacterized protein n=1 Tax=Nephila pilipes TaxID=299642 RepID=A0A8X6QFT8_NEPPI|nr:hypothetical protein NPIL_522391 [Nephila pilipes]